MGTDVEGNSTDLWVADDTGKSKVFKSWRLSVPKTPSVGFARESGHDC